MLEVCSYRLELDALRQELVAAWATTPYPLDEVVRLNARMREVLDASGFTSTPTPELVMRHSPEHRARQSVNMKRVWAARRAARELAKC